jgi:uncharacterized repeat protein (TIGR01451 family)
MIPMWSVAVLMLLNAGEPPAPPLPPGLPTGPDLTPPPQAAPAVPALPPVLTPTSAVEVSKEPPAEAPREAPKDAPKEEKSDKPAEPRLRLEDDLTPPADRPPDPVTNRHDSIVTLEWSGPSLAQVGQPADYTLVVRNLFHQPVHKVQVNVRLTPGMKASNSKPHAVTQGDVLSWQVGTLLPRQEKSLQIELAPSAKGDVNPQAWVQFTGIASSTLHLHVHESKLALQVTSPTRPVVVGDPANFILTVNNVGDGPAGQVKIHVNLPLGLEHPKGKSFDFEVGDLSVGESRTVQLVCLARAGGDQQAELLAESGGAVKAREHGGVTVLIPGLEVQVDGPGLRYVDRKASYIARVKNAGDVTASNVTLSEALPPGFKFVAATDGGRMLPGTDTVSWFLGELGPGQVRQVQLELIATKSGEQHHRFVACSERGFKVEVSKELVTRVDDYAALALDISRGDEAIELGKDTTFEVLISNAGSKTDTNVRLICSIPDKMELKGAQGPSRYHREGSLIIFEPVPKLLPRGDAVYQIKLKALVPGDVRFRSQITSTNLQEPIIKTEPMRIYSDRP